MDRKQGAKTVTDHDRNIGLGESVDGMDLSHADDAGSIKRWGDYSEALGHELQRIASVIGNAAIEHVHVAFLDRDYRILASETIAQGTATSAPCDPHVILRRAAIVDARKLILLHNHPVGGTRPSHEDIDLTDRVAAYAQVMGIALVDHLIVAGERCFSLMRSGLASTRPPKPLRLSIADFARVVVRIEQRKQALAPELRSAVVGAGWTLACVLYFEARPISIVELSTLSGLERTVAALWIVTMREMGLVTAMPSHSAKGVYFIELSDAGSDLLDDLMSTAFGSGPDRVTLRSAICAPRA
jgi:RadC-like JAB domain